MEGIYTKYMSIDLSLSQTQVEILIRLVDEYIDSINAGNKDTIGMGIDDYINLAHDLEASLDEIYS